MCQLSPPSETSVMSHDNNTIYQLIWKHTETLEEQKKWKTIEEPKVNMNIERDKLNKKKKEQFQAKLKPSQQELYITHSSNRNSSKFKLIDQCRCKRFHTTPNKQPLYLLLCAFKALKDFMTVL